MTRTPAQPLSADEAAIVARFDAAPVPDEVVVENLARVLCDTDAGDVGYRWDELEPTEYSGIRDAYRRLAAAAIAAMPPSPSPAEEAVKRVEALCDAQGDDSYVMTYALRAALASSAPAPHVHGAWCHPSADGCPDDLR